MAPTLPPAALPGSPTLSTRPAPCPPRKRFLCARRPQDKAPGSSPTGLLAAPLSRPCPAALATENAPRLPGRAPGQCLRRPPPAPGHLGTRLTCSPLKPGGEPVPVGPAITVQPACAPCPGPAVPAAEKGHVSPGPPLGSPGGAVGRGSCFLFPRCPEGWASSPGQGGDWGPAFLKRSGLSVADSSDSLWG